MEDMATGNIQKSKSLGIWKEITLPFTATTDGMISIEIRPTNNGRYYVQFNSTPGTQNPYFVDGTCTNAIAAYALASFLMPKGTTISVKAKVNVYSEDYYWIPIQ